MNLTDLWIHEFLKYLKHVLQYLCKVNLFLYEEYPLWQFEYIYIYIYIFHNLKKKILISLYTQCFTIIDYISFISFRKSWAGGEQIIIISLSFLVRKHRSDFVLSSPLTLIVWASFPSSKIFSLSRNEL